MKREGCRTKWFLLGSVGLLAGVTHAQDWDEVVAGTATTLNYPFFYDCFDGPVAGVAAGCTNANFRADGHVDLHDFAILQRSYGTLATTAIQPGGEMVGEISPAGDTDVYTFFASQGAFVTVDFYTPTDAGGYPGLFPRIDLLRPNASQANTVSACGNTRLDAVPADATGTWSVRVRENAAWASCGYGPIEALRTGQYLLTVCVSNTPAIPITYGQSLPGAFSSDCQVINYTFTGAVGDVVTATYVAGVSARRLRMFDPAGAEIGVTGQGLALSIVDEVLAANGTFRLSVEALNDGAVGAFGIGLSELDDATPIAFNTPVNATISQLAEVDLYSFNANNGSFVTVDYFIPSDASGYPSHFARIDLIRPDGTIAATNAVCGSFRLDNIAVNQTGSWTVRVRTHEAWANCGYGTIVALTTGSYTLSVCTSDSPPVPLAYGSTVAGNFASDCQIANYTFTGAVGDVVTATYVGGISARRLRMFDPAGAEIGVTGQGLALSIVDEVLAANGTFRLSVEALNDGAVGAFGIGLSELDDATPIAFNTPVNATISQLAEVDLYSFNANNGSFVTVDYFIPSDASGYPSHFARVDLIRPDGTIAATNAVCGSFRLDNIAVNQTGSWTVRVRTHEAWANCGYGTIVALTTGSYTLSVCTSDSPPVPLAYGSTVAGNFASDCQIANYTFTGAVGDVVTATYVGGISARRLRMFDPSGAEIGVTGQGLALSIVDEVLAANGTFRLSVEALNDGAVGAFGIGLSELDDATPIAFNAPVNTTIGQLAEVDLYSFNATNGSFVTVDYFIPSDVSGYPSHFARIDLIRPDGTIAATNAVCGSFRLDNIAVNQTGSWTVRVRTHEAWANCGYGAIVALTTGSYTLSVCTSDSPPVPLAYGSTVAGNFASDCQIANYTFTGAVGDVVTATYVAGVSARRLRMFDPAGAEIGVTGQGLALSIVDEVLAANGTFRLSVEALNDGAVGAFGIGLSELDDATPIAFNTPVNATISQLAEVDLYSFNANNGSFVTVDYFIPSDASGYPSHFARIDLIRPDGTIAATNAVCGSFRLDNIAVNQTGSWTVRVRTHEAWANCGYGTIVALTTGTYRVTVCNSTSCPP